VLPVTGLIGLGEKPRLEDADFYLEFKISQGFLSLINYDIIV